MKLFKPRFESDLRRHTFSQRIIDNWNSLTEKIVNSESLDIVFIYFFPGITGFYPLACVLMMMMMMMMMKGYRNQQIS